MRRGRVNETKAAADELTNAEKRGDRDRGGGAEPERKENPTENDAETRTKRKLGFVFFLFICAPRERKETWTMPSATTGAASPWFTGAGSKTC